MFNHLKTLAISAAVVAAVPALASAQTVSYGKAPVSVTSCSTSEADFGGPITLAGQMIQSQNDIQLGYVNTSNVAATSVTFVVNDGNRTSNVTAHGNFVPGVAINRSFSASADGANGAAACTVAQVQFVDGSTWQAAPVRVVGIR